jgi:hypothetical protein
VERALDPADRLCLVEARDRGTLEVRLWREGRPEPEGEALGAHLRSMCERGLLRLQGQRGSKARMQGSALVAIYEATWAGLAVLEALERAEHAEAEIAQFKRTP